MNGKDEVVRSEGDPVSIASGVVVNLGPANRRAVLTAAHVSRHTPSCGDLTILSQEKPTKADPYGLGLEVPVAHKSVDNLPPRDPETGKYAPDVSLLKPAFSSPEQEQIFTGMPAAEIQKGSNVKVGMVGFAVNFEPTQAEKIRDPRLAGKLGGPAIFSAVAITPIGRDGTFVVLTGVGKSYGSVEDTDGRGGESGGAYFSPNGELEGLTIANGGEYTPQELKHVDPRSPNRVYSTTVVQTVSKGMITAMNAQAAASNACPPPTQPKIVTVP